MIKVEVVVDNNKWKKKIKRANYFFNKVLRFFPKKYKFEKKNIIFSLSFLSLRWKPFLFPVFECEQAGWMEG